MNLFKNSENLVCVFSPIKGNYECLSSLLSSKEVTVQARACGLVGNLLRHTDDFYSVLKSKDDIIQALLLCLVSGEMDVRKVRLVFIKIFY